MDPIERLRKMVGAISGMSHEDFDLSLGHWQQKTYKKGEFYNEYKNVCRYLGFVLTGVFRIYKFLEQSGVEKNMQFFTNDQFMTSYKSFFSQESDRCTELISIHPDICNAVPLYHIASYLGIEGPSLSRIRKRMARPS
jgi:hypothetical protein